MTSIYDSFCTTHPFFCRLENQLYSTMKLVFDLHQNLRYTKTNGGMSIMTTGMHKSTVYRSKSFSCRTMFHGFAFKHTQGINIEPHAHDRTFSTVEDTDNASHTATGSLHKLRISALAHRTFILFLQLCIRRNSHTGIFLAHLVSSQHLITKLGQSSCNQRGGPHLEPSGLCIFMKITASCRQTISHGICQTDDLLKYCFSTVSVHLHVLCPFFYMESGQPCSSSSLRYFSISESDA